MGPNSAKAIVFGPQKRENPASGRTDRRLIVKQARGEVAEWSNALVLKTSDG
jgi:hypothetical protein